MPLKICVFTDCVYIGLLNTQHHENVMNALEAGRNVLCEKPLALSSKEVREMVNKAREKKLFLMEVRPRNLVIFTL
jgi:predicted dehydrogenase